MAALPQVPDAALEALAGDEDSDVAASVVLQYKFLPKGAWDRFIERAGKDEALQRLLIAHPDCPKEVKEALQRRCENCVYSNESYRHTVTKDMRCRRKRDYFGKICSDHQFR